MIFDPKTDIYLLIIINYLLIIKGCHEINDDNLAQE